MPSHHTVIAIFGIDAETPEHAKVMIEHYLSQKGAAPGGMVPYWTEAWRGERKEEQKQPQ